MTTFARLLTDQSGAMAIETAIVAPVLLALAWRRRSRLDGRAPERAAKRGRRSAEHCPGDDAGTSGERTAIKNVLRASTGITATNGVLVTEIWRCGTTTTFERDQAADCGSSAVSTYIEITLTETYTPTWTAFGIGSPMTY